MKFELPLLDANPATVRITARLSGRATIVSFTVGSVHSRFNLCHRSLCTHFAHVVLRDSYSIINNR